MTVRASAEVTVIDPGLLSTLQDAGRHGRGAMGVSPSGAADWYSARAANRLVGNTDDMPLIEATLTGITFDALGAVTFAVTGADASLRVGARPGQAWRSCRAGEGDRIVVGPAVRGARSYVAFAGGIAGAPRVLGSASTDVVGGFGGRVLARGDTFSIGASAGESAWLAYPPDAFVSLDSPMTLRAVRGPNAVRISDQAVEDLCAREYRVTARSSRQALRLEGDAVDVRSPVDALTAGVCAGCVQVTGDGRPMILLCEHQTTGGYPVALCVIWADVPRAAQARPGDIIRFEMVGFGVARDALFGAAARLGSLTASNQAPRAVEAELGRGFFEGAEP
jgi:biotin-dependent carboxylase-like uncharacterized protein